MAFSLQDSFTWWGVLTFSGILRVKLVASSTRRPWYTLSLSIVAVPWLQNPVVWKSKPLVRDLVPVAVSVFPVLFPASVQ